MMRQKLFRAQSHLANIEKRRLKVETRPQFIHFQTHLHGVANALNMRSCVRRLRAENRRHASLHQMTNAFGSVKTVLRHNPFDFGVKLRARQDLIVGVYFVDCIAERNFLWICRLMVIVVWQRGKQTAWKERGRMKRLSLKPLWCRCLKCSSDCAITPWSRLMLLSSTFIE